MFLKSLSLKGFKSFADTTTLEFEPGVTVVVGPNGSGKSNIVDAVAWVLGAQGPRTLRSAKMEDVIFAGTPRRAALGRAEVALTIDNSAGLLPIDFSEVTITRILFRSGDSEYAINGVPCRLLDVQELLSDTGVGRQQHVIVSQGQLDTVLNSRPEDRRLVIEEAAGVLKYRRRREKAQRRLESTEGSLLRLQDLLREVRRQLKPLERQADAARRHEGLVDELRAVRLFLAGRELAAIEGRLANGGQSRTELTRAEDEVRAALAGLDADVVAAEGQLGDLRTQADSTDLAEALSRAEGLRARARGLGAVLAERSRSVERDRAATVDQGVIANLESEAARLTSELAAVDVEATELVPQADEVVAAEADLAAETLKFEAEWDQSTEAPGGAAAEVRGELGARRSAVERTTSELRRVESQLNALTERLARLEEEAERLVERQADLAAATEPLEASLETAAAHRQTAEQAAGQAEDAWRAAQAQEHRWSARAEALAQALDEVRAQAGAERLAEVGGVVGSLLEVVDIDEGWEAAFEAAAGEALAATVVDSVETARRCLDHLRAAAQPGAVLALPDLARIPSWSWDGKGAEMASGPEVSPGPGWSGPDAAAGAGRSSGLDGSPGPHAAAGADLAAGAGRGAGFDRAGTGFDRAGFDGSSGQEAPSRLSGTEANGPGAASTEANGPGAAGPEANGPGAAGPAPAAAVALRSHVRGRLPGVGELLDRLLDGAVVVTTGWADALDVSLNHPELIAVTPEGDRFSTTSWRTGMSGSGATGAALEQAQAAAEEATVTARQRATVQEQAKAELAAARGTEADLARQVDSNRSGLDATADALRRTRTESEDTRAERDTQAAHQAELADRLLRDEQRVDELDALLPALEQAAAAEAERALAERAARSRLSERAAAVAALKRDLEVRAAALEERKTLLTRRLAEVEERLDRHVRERAEAAERRQDLERAAVALTRLGAQVSARTKDLDGAVDRLREARREESETTRAVTDRLEQLRRHRSAAERQLAELKERASRVELDEAEGRVRLENLVDTIRRDLDCEPEATRGAECPPLPPGTSPTSRVRELERELRLLGPINPLALEEYSALQERHLFLEAQLEDVRSGRRELTKVIKAIDSEIIEVFRAAYADVADNFEKLFATLFPGGQGRLRLTDPDHLLETGIEIEARPSGKNVRRLSLLSGGERSLTALAFLFAVFRSRPSPFYLMDEVEAALDDVNLHRFLDLIHEFRDEAQLLVVSHQKRTMEAADCLYGVTMQPGGSSRVVSERIRAGA